MQDSPRVLEQLYAASAVPEFVWARPPLSASPPPHQPQPSTQSPQSPALMSNASPQEKTAMHEWDAGHDGQPYQPSAPASLESNKGAGAAGGAQVAGGALNGLSQASRYPLAALAAHALKLRCGQISAWQFCFELLKWASEYALREAEMRLNRAHSTGGHTANSAHGFTGMLGSFIRGFPAAPSASI
eukprot:1161704-Pelagomonas_calceolata.AAC.13